jgi:CRISPR-associated protein Csb2
MGRFHATLWRANPFADPHGEWPPSPWRLARAVVGRWHQLRREEPGHEESELDALLTALAASRVAFYLPLTASRGSGIRQYHPAEFKKVPPAKKEPGLKTYSRTLFPDHWWSLPEDDPVYWFLDGAHWTDSVLRTLDSCLARMAYFGRAESLVEISRVQPQPDLVPNAELLEDRVSGAVPVLGWTPETTRTQIEAGTDDKSVRGVTLPPGARWLFARRPPPAPRIERPRPSVARAPVRILQFAIACAVEPPVSAVVRLTSRFRGRTIRALALTLSGSPGATWRTVDPATREKLSGVAGKESEGDPLLGHRHAAYVVWWEDERPSRLLVWRQEPFSADEESALLKAAELDLPWSYGNARWAARLVPLDRAVGAPPGFDGRRATCWETVTPYVPARHVFGRNGRIKPGESIEEQIRRDLAARGLPHRVALDVHGISWVAVHVPRRATQAEVTRRGYRLTLRFDEPVSGPLLLGHSSSFGLGLFMPANGVERR